MHTRNSRALRRNALMSNRAKKVISCVLIVLAAGLIAAGVMNGGYRDVWAKARTVCLECIGIG